MILPEKELAALQAIFRGHMVRQWMILRGNAAPPVVNDTDFYTFEEIPKLQRFYFHEEESAGGGGEHTYVFSISSLELLYSKFRHNPYTRRAFTDHELQRIARFLKLSEILGFHISAVPKRTSVLDLLIERRGETVSVRIQKLFEEIDSLGNYTNPHWFSDLCLEQCIEYWTVLYDIWGYRAEILPETKREICPYYASPFDFKNLLMDFLIFRRNLTKEIVQDYCLWAMENMVYMSDNEEFRKLGAMYVLAALAVVSTRARDAMPWLYDVVVY